MELNIKTLAATVAVVGFLGFGGATLAGAQEDPAATDDSATTEAPAVDDSTEDPTTDGATDSAEAEAAEDGCERGAGGGSGFAGEAETEDTNDSNITETPDTSSL